MLSVYQKFNDYIRKSLSKTSKDHIFEINSETDENKCYIEQLPEEILLNIFSYLSLDDLCNCSSVTTKWNRICDDSLLWNYRLFLESYSWVGILPKASAITSSIHPKQSYLSIIPIHNLSSIEWIRSGLFVYLSLIVKSYWGHKSPHIAVMGSGLDNYRTKSLFDDMFHNQCSEFEPIGQFMPSVGSGITMNLISDDNYSYKFHFYLLYSFKAMSKSPHFFQEQRIKSSVLFERLDETDGLDKLKMLENVKDIFTSLNGLIYAIDGQDREVDFQSLVYEFKEAIRAVRENVPVLLILINSNTTIATQISTFQIAQLFELFNLQNPWCILSCSVNDIHVVKLGITWIIQKTFKM